MTFDLLWTAPPPEKVAAVEELARRAGAVQSKEDWEGVITELNELRDYRFGCNNWFMGRLTKVLLHLGMLDTEFRHSGFKGNEEQDEMVVQEFDAADGRPPAYKFYSNDGWLVSPKEIEKALEVYDGFAETHGNGSRQLIIDVALNGDTESIARFADFIEFWRDAREHGGFKVW